VADRDGAAGSEGVPDGAVGATVGVADGAAGPTDSDDGTATNDCDEPVNADGGVEGAPARTPGDDATDPLSDPTDAPDDPDDLALLEQPASIPSTARLTPAHRRPRIFLLSHPRLRRHDTRGYAATTPLPPRLPRARAAHDNLAPGRQCPSGFVGYIAESGGYRLNPSTGLRFDVRLVAERT
jgi:hypothetical protein